jgi:hypothetical protein
LGAVTKMIADMICGPAFIVMARGRMARFMVTSRYSVLPCGPIRVAYRP